MTNKLLQIPTLKYLIVAWALMWSIPAYVCLGAFSFFVGLINLSVEEGLDTFKRNIEG